jgi:hypothetical protein
MGVILMLGVWAVEGAVSEAASLNEEAKGMGYLIAGAVECGYTQEMPEFLERIAVRSIQLAAQHRFPVSSFDEAVRVHWTRAQLQMQQDPSFKVSACAGIARVWPEVKRNLSSAPSLNALRTYR